MSIFLTRLSKAIDLAVVTLIFVALT